MTGTDFERVGNALATAMIAMREDRQRGAVKHVTLYGDDKRALLFVARMLNAAGFVGPGVNITPYRREEWSSEFQGWKDSWRCLLRTIPAMPGDPEPAGVREVYLGDFRKPRKEKTSG